MFTHQNLRPIVAMLTLLFTAYTAQAGTIALAPVNAPMQLADASPLPGGFIPLHAGPAIRANAPVKRTAGVLASHAGPDAKGFYTLVHGSTAVPLSHFEPPHPLAAPAKTATGVPAAAPPVVATLKPLDTGSIPAAAQTFATEDEAAADDDGDNDDAMKLFHGAEKDMASMPTLKSVMRNMHVTQAWPLPTHVEQKFASAFGMRRDPFTGKPEFHAGVDLAAKQGTPVLASADGIVEESQTSKGFGRVIVIRHRDGVESLYGHLSAQDVKVGQHVMQGQKIGTVGSTGRSTGAHLHFQLEENGRPVNPMLALNAPLETGIRVASR